MFDGTLLLADEERIRMASTGGLLLVHLRRAVEAEQMLAIHAMQEQMRERVGKHAVLVIVGEVRTELSDRTRELAKHTSTTFRDHVSCVAHVVEVRGFVGAAIRCVMAGMRMLHRPPYPIREFASVGGAVGWMLPSLRRDAIELPIGVDAAAIEGWVAATRADSSPPE
ncbi:hypothetical protein ACNOYE_26760 [Nannocystaceae bacterium ST9]